MKKKDNVDFENKFNQKDNKSQENEDREVARGTEDWNYVDFLLKSSVSSNCQLQKLFNIKNQHLKVKFNKFSEGKVVINAWFNANSLSDSIFLKKISQTGFDVPSHGIDIWTGNIYEEPPDEHYTDHDNTYILCKVIVGKTYVKIFKNKNDLSTIENIKFKPADYDSVLLWIKDTEKSQNFIPLKNYKYRIFESEKILPTHIVNFDINDESNIYEAIRFCEECGAEPAIYNCIQCDTDLCEADFNLIHNPDNKQLFNFHEKIKIEKNKPGYCNCDNKNKTEFYCEDCNIPLCSFCKILGTHSKGLNKDHNIKEIDIAWKSKGPESNEIFSNSHKISNKAYDFLSKISHSSNTNLKSTSYKDAKTSLHAEFNKEIDYCLTKSNKLISKELELINRLNIVKNMVNWLDTYFKDREMFFKENKNSKEYIWLWGYHVQFLDALINNLSHIPVAGSLVIFKTLVLTKPSLNNFIPIKLIFNEYNIDKSDKKNKKYYRMTINDGNVIINRDLGDDEDKQKNDIIKTRPSEIPGNKELIKLLSSYFTNEGRLNNEDKND